MLVSSEEMRQEAKKLWPDLDNIWLMDKVFTAPRPEVFQEALRLSNVPSMEFIPEANDCDDFALQFMAEVRRKRYFQYVNKQLTRENYKPISATFGFGDQFRGISKIHVANPCFTEDGFYMIDTTPGENRMWKAKTDQDHILFLFA